jgi:hypothetical protein
MMYDLFPEFSNSGQYHTYCSKSITLCLCLSPALSLSLPLSSPLPLKRYPLHLSYETVELGKMHNFFEEKCIIFPPCPPFFFLDRAFRPCHLLSNCFLIICIFDNLYFDNYYFFDNFFLPGSLAALVICFSVGGGGASCVCVCVCVRERERERERE